MATRPSSYEPVITPIDVFTKQRALQSNIHSTRNGKPFGTIAINNSFLERANTFGIVYFHVLTISLYIAIMYYSESVHGVHAVYVNYFTTYVLVSIFANYYLAIRYNAVFKPVESCDLPNEKWAFCSYCQHQQPPRCHHCPLCHTCISKRDHHCFFIGTCIGQRNQGYFAIYCFHVFVGLYIGFNILSVVLSNTYYELYSLDFFHYLPPMALFDVLRGQADILTFFLTILVCGSFVTGIFTVGLFLWQCLLIACDLTTYDAQITWNKSGFLSLCMKVKLWRNIKAVFGPVPFLPFLIPLPMSLFLSKANYNFRSNKPFL